MRTTLVVLLLSLSLTSAPGRAAEPADISEAQTLISNFAQCYAYYTMSHFFWGSRNDRERLRFYLERTELAYVYATQLGTQHGISEHFWANASLTHRNIMMSEIEQDLNQIGILSRTYEPRCEALMAQIPPDVMEHYENIKHDLRNEPSI